MKLRKIIKIPVYSCKVIIYIEPEIGDTYRELLAKFKQEDDDDVGFDGLVMNTPGDVTTYHMLLATNALDQNVLTHESVHLAVKILKHRGHDSLSGGDEPLAYLSGFIAAEIDKILIRNNIELKKPRMRNAKKIKDIHLG